MSFWQWILSLFGQKPPAPRPKPPPKPEPEPEPIAALLDAMNEVRADHNLPPLVHDLRLEVLAQGWAEKMARWNVLTHGDFQGRFDAVYPNHMGEENIAKDDRGAEAVVMDWMSSAGHRANIVGVHTHAGCGHSGDYWCAVFALLGT